MTTYPPNHDPATCGVCRTLPAYLVERDAALVADAERWGDEIAPPVRTGPRLAPAYLPLISGGLL